LKKAASFGGLFHFKPVCDVRFWQILLQKSAIEERGIFRDFLRPFVATCSI